MDVRLPDGTILTNVPEGTTKEQIAEKLAGRHGFPALGEPAGVEAPPPSPEEGGTNAPGEGSQTLNVLGELAASANRSVTEFIDFLGPDTVNAVLRLAGSEKQVPTLTGALESTGIQGGFMEPGTARDITRAAGSTLTAAGGLVPVQRQAAAAGSAVLDFLGAGSTAVGTGGVRGAADFVVQNTPPSPVVSRKAKEVEIPLKRQTGDRNTFGFTLDQSGKVVADPRQHKAAEQGFDEGFVAMVGSSSKKTRDQFRRIIEEVEKGKKNYLYEASNRPLDVVGESIINRFDVVKSANRAAGSKLDSVAKNLKGQPVDVQPAVGSLLGKLDDMGIQFDPASGKLNFDGSDLEKLPGPQRVVRNMLDRMRNTKAPDAYDIHRMKRFIDEQVTYGKTQRGLGGRAEGVFKSLRHDLDAILDQNFPEYNKVNTQYAETISALDALQDVAGKKMDLLGPNANKAVGTLSRRLLSNAQSRVTLMDALEQLDTTASKYISPNSTDLVPYGQSGQAKGGKHIGITADDLDDNLMAQVKFIDELEKMFGTAAGTSLQGDVSKATERAIDAAAGSQTVTGLVVEGTKAGLRKARGINEENALKAIKELVSD